MYLQCFLQSFDFCEKKWPPKIDFRLVVLMSVNVVVAIQPYRRDDGLGMNGIQMPPLFIGTDARSMYLLTQEQQLRSIHD